MNHTLLGVMGAGNLREGLREADVSGRPGMDDKCLNLMGGCESWQESEAGEARYAELQRRWKAMPPEQRQPTGG